MTAKTVGELKKALNEFGDNMPIDFMATFIDRGRTNYVVTDRYGVPQGEGIILMVYQNGGYCRIENLDSADLVLED